jgi:hypothetical protein
MKCLLPQQQHIIDEIRKLLPNVRIDIGEQLNAMLLGFRGKKGLALAAVYPNSSLEIYQLIHLFKQLNVGYLLQGANTSLKGQSTPNGENIDVMIIKTNLLSQMKVIDIPNQEQYKILLVEPGVSLKKAEVFLNEIGFLLPHKTGSHDFGNTFGGSCANACGGIEVNNRDGRASMTHQGNMGVVAISAEGIIYNGFIKSDKLQSGKEILEKIDNQALGFDDIEMPNLDEINNFLKQLFHAKSFPIKNHRGDLLFPGDGGEGSQAIVYQMYLIQRKPIKSKNYIFLFHDLETKIKFYNEVLLSEGDANPQSLPTVCESMNDKLVHLIVNQGCGFLIAAIFSLNLSWINKHIGVLFKLRKGIIHRIPKLYIFIESLIGKILAKLLIPKDVYGNNFKEMLIMEVSDYHKKDKHILKFEKKLKVFIKKHQKQMQQISIKDNSYQEKLILHVRTISALSTLTLEQQNNATLLAFDNAVMPGKMLMDYVGILKEEILKLYPNQLLGPYLYGHDLKQISHNDWLIKQKLSYEAENEIYHMHYGAINKVGGYAHAEHGVGDHADTDLCREELIKLVAHRLVNDTQGLANPGGAYQRAYLNACAHPEIYKKAVEMAKVRLEQEHSKGTLWLFNERVNKKHIEELIKNIPSEK